jgi:hypothetical protein
MARAPRKDQTETPPGTHAAVPWILWGSFLNAIVIYVIVLAFLVPVPTVAERSVVLPAVLAGLAVLEVALFFALRAPLARRLGECLPYVMIRWASAEAVAILGVVLKLIGYGWTIAAPFLLAGFALLLLLPPNRLRSEYEELRGGGN